jgi:hypothetical protein
VICVTPQKYITLRAIIPGVLRSTEHKTEYCICAYVWLYSPLLDLDSFDSLMTFYAVGRAPLTGDRPVSRQLPVHRIAQT